MKISDIRIVVLSFLLLILLMPLQSAYAKGVSSLNVGPNSAVNEEGIPFPWTLKENKGEAHANIISENGEPALRLYSENSSFSLQREFHADTREYPYITWSWKALSLPVSGDVRKKEKNDQALQVLVAFENHHVLSYIWDANAPVGTVSDESLPWPVSLKVKVLVVKSGLSDTDKWLTVTRNIYADYKKIFHEEPSPVKGIRIQINTQHTGESAQALLKEITFSQAPQNG